MFPVNKLLSLHYFCVFWKDDYGLLDFPQRIIINDDDENDDTMWIFHAYYFCAVQTFCAQMRVVN